MPRPLRHLVRDTQTGKADIHLVKTPSSGPYSDSQVKNKDSGDVLSRRGERQNSQRQPQIKSRQSGWDVAQ